MQKVKFKFLNLLIIPFILTGCYYIESTNSNDYVMFYRKLEEIMPMTYSMLPALENIKNIDDIILYYSDYDLIDSYYTIYLECTFEQEQFKEEKQRLNDFVKESEVAEIAIYDSNEFNYSSIYINQDIHSDTDDFAVIYVSYVLFDDINNKIIYVDIFEEGGIANGRSISIPEKYLPRKLLELRQQKTSM